MLAGMPEPDEESAAWLRELRGARPDRALARLRALLLRAARREAARRAGAVIAGVELDDLAEQAADDALLAIVAKLPSFRGESRFTTWAYKFAVLEVASKVSRHAWRTAPVALDGESWERLPDRFGFDAAEAVEQRALLDAVRHAVSDVLTPHQRRVFVALVLNGVPLDVLVDELDTTRNALYKTVFDARRKVRAQLVANGQLDP
jgi:RNA polymerase sigma-70 factor (ECF subfamily)